MTPDTPPPTTDHTQTGNISQSQGIAIGTGPRPSNESCPVIIHNEHMYSATAYY